jgi:hypothetical protein
MELVSDTEHLDGETANCLVVMGQIPSTNNMISVVITNPQNGDDIESGQDFDIEVQTLNLEAGSFTNAAATYYAAPQQLEGGNVVGHLHVTVQDTGANLNPTQPLDPTEFAFFKGINDAGDGQGKLTAAVTGGLPAGNYRLCTLTSAANHQPVIMPVAQRGSQDDCVRFTVSGNVDTINPAASDGENGLAAKDQIAEAVALGPGAPNPGGNDGGDEEGGEDSEGNIGGGRNKGGGGNNGGGNGGGNNAGGNNGGGNGEENNGGGNNGGGNGGGNNNAGGNDNDDGGNNGGGNNGGNGNGNGRGKGKGKGKGKGNTGNEDDEDEGNGGGRGKGKGGRTDPEAASTPAASETVSETDSPADPSETPGAGRGKRRTDRLARLSRRRRFIA